MDKMKKALEFIERQLGSDIEIISMESQGEDVKVVWSESNDSDRYFMVVGLGKFGRVIEKQGGSVKRNEQ